MRAEMIGESSERKSDTPQALRGRDRRGWHRVDMMTDRRRRKIYSYLMILKRDPGRLRYCG
jgi:hypothetical protein